MLHRVFQRAGALHGRHDAVHKRKHLLRFVSHAAHDSDAGNAGLLTASAYARNHFAVSGLPVDAPFPGDDEIRVLQVFVETHEIQHRIGTGAHLRVQEDLQSRTQAAGGACPGKARIRPEIAF